MHQFLNFSALGFDLLQNLFFFLFEISLDVRMLSFEIDKGFKRLLDVSVFRNYANTLEELIVDVEVFHLVVEVHPI